MGRWRGPAQNSTARKSCAVCQRNHTVGFAQSDRYQRATTRPVDAGAVVGSIHRAVSTRRPATAWFRRRTGSAASPVPSQRGCSDSDMHGPCLGGERRKHDKSGRDRSHRTAPLGRRQPARPSGTADGSSPASRHQQPIVQFTHAVQHRQRLARVEPRAARARPRTRRGLGSRRSTQACRSCVVSPIINVRAGSVRN